MDNPAYTDEYNGQYQQPAQGQYPPAGQQGQYPPQGQQGQYPPQGQQVQYPAQGQYPPPQGQYPPPGPTVTQQPGGPQEVQWMAKPSGFAGCPPGLEYLTQIDQLVVKQQVELLEVFTGWESANKYKILNSMGQQIFFAAEESDACMRQTCGPSRGFEIHITDNAGQEVIRCSREFKCCAGWCWCAKGCCAHEVRVEAPVGTVAGYVRQEISGWSPHFSVRTADDTKVGVLRGPCCIISGPCCPDVGFDVLNVPNEDTTIGRIAKKWTGAVTEYFTDADTFSVSFPMDMDVRAKAVFMGAVFLLDFMYFETSNNNNH